MDHEILLCTTLAYGAHPELLGLPEDSFSHQYWLALESFSDRARKRAHLHPWREIWVMDVEDMMGINLAHALMRDNPDTRVILFSAEKSGSYYSRVHTAGIEHHASLSGFATYFSQVKNKLYADYVQVTPEEVMQAARVGASRGMWQGSMAGSAWQADAEEAVWQSGAAEAGTTQGGTAQGGTAQGGASERYFNSRGEFELARIELAGDPRSSGREDARVDSHAASAGLGASGLQVVQQGSAGISPGRADARSLRASGLQIAQQEILRAPDTRSVIPGMPRLTPSRVAESHHPSCVISVLGAGGGVGTSTISTLIAFACARFGNKTALIDADFQLGDLAHVMGLERPLRSNEVLEKPARLDVQSQDGSSAPLLVAAPLNVEDSELIRAQIHALIDEVTRRFDVVVMDTALSWDDAHIEMLSRSHASVFVIDQRPSSLRACRHLLALCARCGVATQAFTYVINRCSRKSLFSSIDVSCSLQGAHVHELCEAGPHLEELFGLGRPQDYFDEQPKFVQQIINLTREILPQQFIKQELASATKPKGFFGKRR